ncbi:MAG TPA: hypothetical protein PKM65_02270 [Spirochaetota bacterium]|nr:hypothetical protein [Spirochaetota bacterium]HNT12091.1 hypothetical protein [Spirochaetota bacterium]
MRYFIFAAIVAAFLIVYVWQNVEVMRIKMGYDEIIRKERQLMDRNDRLRYQIERFRRMDAIESYARGSGMRPIGPDDFQAIAPKNMKSK